MTDRTEAMNMEKAREIIPDDFIENTRIAQSNLKGTMLGIRADIAAALLKAHADGVQEGMERAAEIATAHDVVIGEIASRIASRIRTEAQRIKEGK